MNFLRGRLLSRFLGRLSAPVRILAWSAAISIPIGAVNFFEPADRLLQGSRDAIRSRPSSGEIVVVKIDNRALRESGGIDGIRRTDARLIDTLFKLGARRVFIDRVFADKGLPSDDRALIDTFKRYRGRVFLGATFQEDHATGEREPLLPAPAFREHVQIASALIRKDILGYTTGVPLASTIGNQRYASFSTLIAGKPLRSEALFRPDYSISYRSIPSISSVDVLNGSPAATIIGKRDVIVGNAAEILGDIHSLPGQGLAPGAYVHAIGAETLRSGVPTQIGWWPPLAAVLAISIAFLYARRRRERIAALAVGIVALVAAPFGFDALGIGTTVTPAALFFTIVVVRTRILRRVINSPITGLPLLERMSGREELYPGTIVGLKVHNLADLRSNLSTAEERVLVAEIVRRVRVGHGELEIVQGDDSFIWHSELPVSPELTTHIEALHHMLSMPIALGARSVDLTIAFGLDGETDRRFQNRAGSAQVSADDALAASERWRVHDPLRLHDADFRLSLLSQLDRAVTNGEIWVAYQPKLDLSTKRICGSEALVRWRHPERGPIGPDKFILAAEAANRIEGVTNLVLETAIRDTASLDHIDPNLSVAVNLSVRMLAVPGFVESVATLLRTYNFRPDRLTLEVTESAEINFDGPALRTLAAVRDLGVKISIDDYGTRYSTLDYVRQLPASEIKIDRGFIGPLLEDDGCRIMVQSTIELAHSLGLRVVAEGVELPATMAALTEMGCDVLQGYLIGKPQPFQQLKGFLESFDRVKAA